MKQIQKIFITLTIIAVFLSVFSGCQKTSVGGNAKSIKTDYLVVGGGAAGLMTALELSSKGKVVLLEKMPALGGTSIRAKGFLWSVDSTINKSTGKGLTAKELFEYYKEKAGEQHFNGELFQAMLDVSGSTIDSLLEEGIPFSKEKLVSGTPNKPELLCLTVEGEAPAMIGRFKELLEENKVEVLLNTRAFELIVKDGAVEGVKAEQGDKTYTVFAKKTILATGGFANGKDLMLKYNEKFADNVPFCGIGNTGDGITMALQAGAQLVGDGVLGIWGMNKNYGYVGDIGSLVRQTAFYINKEGRRFVNEKRYYAEVHKELNEITDKLAYGLFDSSRQEITTNLEKALAEGLSVKAESIEELAQLLNLDANELKASVEKYNAAYASGTDGEFGIKNKVMTPILQAPFYAVEVRPTIIGTIKGLKVNSKTQVLNSQNKPIPNLYAVGELIIGNFINNEYPSTGTVLATALYSGKIAADNASIKN